MKIKTFVAFAFLGVCMVSPAHQSWACIGGNTPEKLEARAREHFAQADVSKDDVLSLREFLDSNGREPSDNSSVKDWALYYKERLDFVEKFKAADKDHSGSLSYEEWFTTLPPHSFMVRGGCGE